MVGDAVTLTVTTISDTVICFPAPPVSLSFDYELGVFPAGTYTLALDTISVLPGVTYPSLTTTFTVGPAPRSIPTMSLAGLIGLGLTLLMLVIWVRPGIRHS